MAIDANILLQGRVPDAVGAVGQGFQLGQTVRQAPIRNQLLQQQADAGKLQMDAETAKFQLSDAATDALQIKPLLNSPEQASAMFQRRIAKIQARGGDPSDTVGVWQRYQSGDVQGASAELDAVIGAAEKAGLLGKGNADNSYYTTVQTSTGVYRFNNRTGQYEPMAGPDGKPVLPTAADPNAQAAVASARQNAQNRSDLTYKPQIAENVAQSEADVALKTKPNIESKVTTAKETAKADAARSADVIKKIGDEKEVGRILDMAVPLLDEATESLAGAAVDAAGRVVGVSTKGAQSAARLKALEGALIMKMPRMEGPQSNMDQMLYRQMAAQIGDATVPAEVRKAAVETLRGLNQRYSGAQQSQQPAQQGPSAGQVEDGYRFKGGNPADPNNWEPAR